MPLLAPASVASRAAIPTGGPPAGQLDALTSLRGLAALIVVLYHFTGGFLPHLALSPVTQFVQKGYLWVDLFFLLSGFIMMHVYGRSFGEGLDWVRTRAFLFARFARIYPLHLVILMGFVGLELVKMGLQAVGVGVGVFQPFTGERTVAWLFAHLGMVHAVLPADSLTWNGPAWSIGAEWVAYVAFPLAALAMAGVRGAAHWVLAAAFAALLLVITQGGRDFDVTHTYGVWRCLAGFALGMLLYRGACHPLARGLSSDAAVAVVLATLALAMHLGVRDALVMPLFALLIVGLAHNAGRLAAVLSARPLVFLGVVSYSVYLSHMLVLEVVNAGSRAVTGEPLGPMLGATGSVLVLLALVGVVVAWSAWLYRRVEAPARQALRDSPFGRRYIDADTSSRRVPARRATT